MPAEGLKVETDSPELRARPSAPPAAPASAHAGVERRADGVWIVPAAASGAALPRAVASTVASNATPVLEPRLRVVGPGRRERMWQRREAALEGDLDRLRRELETAQLVERGSQRLTDRIEADLVRERSQTAQMRQAQARLLVTLGALQRENEGLRRRLELAPAPAPGLGPGAAGGEGSDERRSLWQRLFGTGRRKVDRPRRG